MPVVLLSAHSLRQRRYRKAQASASSTTFSWVIFFIAVSTFTVWSLGASTCTSVSERASLITYYRSEAVYARAFASVLLLLQQLSDQLLHVLPAVVAALLLHHPHSVEPDPTHQAEEPEGGLHQAELHKARDTQRLLRLLALTAGAGQHQTEEPAAAS